MTGSANHGLAAHEVVLLPETNPELGLSEQEATVRLRRFGQNVLPAVEPTRPLIRLLRQLSSPLVLILLVAGAVALALGEHVRCWDSNEARWSSAGVGSAG